MRFRSIQSPQDRPHKGRCEVYSRNPYEIQVNTKASGSTHGSPAGPSRNPYEIQVNTKNFRAFQQKVKKFAES